MKVRWQHRALRDLYYIWRDLAEENPKAAAEVRDRIDQLTGYLGYFPRLGRIWSRERRVRRFVVPEYPYLIYYRVRQDRDEVEILRVRHGRRRPLDPNA